MSATPRIMVVEVHPLSIGSLGFHASILAAAWVQRWLARGQEDPGRGIGRKGDRPGGDGHQPPDWGVGYPSEVYLVGGSEWIRPFDTEIHRVRPVEPRRTPQRRAE